MHTILNHKELWAWAQKNFDEYYNWLYRMTVRENFISNHPHCKPPPKHRYKKDPLKP